MPLVQKQEENFLAGFDRQVERVIRDVCLCLEQDDPKDFYINFNTWIELAQSKSEGECFTQHLNHFFTFLMKKQKYQKFEQLLIAGIAQEVDRDYMEVLSYLLSNPVSIMFFSEDFWLSVLESSFWRHLALQALLARQSPSIIVSKTLLQLEEAGQYISVKETCHQHPESIPASIWLMYILTRYETHPVFCYQLLSLLRETHLYPLYYYTIIRYAVGGATGRLETFKPLLQHIFSNWIEDYRINFTEPRIAFTHWALAELAESDNPYLQVFSIILLAYDHHLPFIAEKTLSSGELKLQARRLTWKNWWDGSYLGRQIRTIQASQAAQLIQLYEMDVQHYYEKLSLFKGSLLQYFPDDRDVYGEIKASDKWSIAKFMTIQNRIRRLLNTPDFQTHLNEIAPTFPIESYQDKAESIMAKYFYWLVVKGASHHMGVSYLFGRLQLLLNQCEQIESRLQYLQSCQLIQSVKALQAYQDIVGAWKPLFKNMEFTLVNTPAETLHREKRLTQFKTTLLDWLIKYVPLIKAWFYQAGNLSLQIGKAKPALDYQAYCRLHGLSDSEYDELSRSDCADIYFSRFSQMISLPPAISTLEERIEAANARLALEMN